MFKSLASWKFVIIKYFTFVPKTPWAYNISVSFRYSYYSPVFTQEIVDLFWLQVSMLN